MQRGKENENILPLAAVALVFLGGVGFLVYDSIKQDGQIHAQPAEESAPSVSVPETDNDGECKRINKKNPSSGYAWKALGKPDTVVFLDRQKNDEIERTVIEVNGKMGRLPRLVHRGDAICIFSEKGSFLPNPQNHKSVAVAGSYGGIFKRY